MEGAKDTQMNYLQKRIVYDEDIFIGKEIYEQVLEQLLEDSKYIALSIRYPYKDYSNMSLPTKYNNWQLRCCVELYNLIGKENIKSYSENGIQWTKDSSNISHDLYNEIEPMVGYIDENNA